VAHHFPVAQPWPIPRRTPPDSPTSTTSWEDAAAQAVKTAGDTLHGLRVAEVVGQDIHLDEGGGITFRTKLQLSFK